MIENDVAIVTGGTSGIGRAICRKFGQNGAKVIVTDIMEEPRGGGKPTADVITDNGGDAIFVESDVTDYDEMMALAETATEEYGSLDIMVNNAGILVESKLDAMTKEEWNRVVDVNINGMYHGMKSTLSVMLEQESGGNIINVSSISGKIGRKVAPAYCASKGAATLLTRQTAIDYGSEDIRVNAVAPGGVLTELARENMNDERHNYLETRTPMGRLGKPEEIADASLFLASDLSSYVNGHLLVVDGGFSIA